MANTVSKSTKSSKKSSDPPRNLAAAGAELLRNDEGFRSMADNMPNLAWMADKDGWIYWYNLRWYEYTGTTPKDMEGWGWQSVHDSSKLPDVLAGWKGSIATGEPFDMVFPLKSAAGQYNPFLTRVVPIHNKAGEIVQWFGTNTDVSEQIRDRERVEELAVQQRAATDLLVNVLETMGDAFLVLDADWIIRHVNKNQERVSKTRRKDTIGKNFWEVFPDASRPDSKYWIEYHAVARTRQSAHFVERYPPLDIWTEVDVYPMDDGGISIFFRDITERIRAEQAVVGSEARFRFMAESMPQQVWTATPDGQLDYVNEQAVEYFQKSAESIVGDGWQTVLHPDDVQTAVEAWTLAIETGKVYETKFRLRRADDDTFRWHLVRALPMRGESDEILKWFGSNTDIDDIINTTRQRDELENVAAVLRTQRAELEALNRSKDEFISLASHQLRTPATGVKQYVGMLLEGYAGDMTGQQLRFVEQAYASNERQLKIVNDLLKVARVDAGKVKLHQTRVRLEPLIAEIIAEQASQFVDKHQSVVFKQTGDADYVIRTDKDLLRMVLENLIDNANKYTYEDKTITIKLTKSKQLVTISITDEGVGIASEDIAKLGQKFNRIDNPLTAHVDGTGLGLYWVQKVIGLLDGLLVIRSKVGTGSTFAVKLRR